MSSISECLPGKVTLRDFWKSGKQRYFLKEREDAKHTMQIRGNTIYVMGPKPEQSEFQALLRRIKRAPREATLKSILEEFETASRQFYATPQSPVLYHQSDGTLRSTHGTGEKDSPPLVSAADAQQEPQRSNASAPIKLPKKYVAHMSDLTRSPEHNFNYMLTEKHAQLLGFDPKSIQWLAFMGSGLGPSEWQMLNNGSDYLDQIVKELAANPDSEKGRRKLLNLAVATAALEKSLFPPSLGARLWAAIEEKLPHASPSDMVRAYVAKTAGQNLETARGVIRSYIRHIFGKNRGSYPPNMSRAQANDLVNLQIEAWLRKVRTKVSSIDPVPSQGQPEDARQNFDVAESDSSSATSVASEAATSEDSVETNPQPAPSEVVVGNDQIFDQNVQNGSVQDIEAHHIGTQRARARSAGQSAKPSSIDLGVQPTKQPSTGLQINKSSRAREIESPVNRAAKQSKLILDSLIRTQQEQQGIADAHRERLREAEQTIRELADEKFSLSRELTQPKTSYYQNLLGATFTNETGGVVQVIQAQDFGNAVQYFKDGNRPRYSTTCGIVCLVETPEAEICGGSAKVFVSDAMLQRAASRNWAMCNNDVRTAFFSQLGDSNYPRLQVMGVSSDTRLQRVVLDYILGGSELPKISDLPYRMDDCRYSVDGGVVTQARIRIKEDRGDQVRAYQIVGDQMEGILFDKSTENLNLMALKRLTSRFSTTNWANRKAPQWITNLYGQEHLEIGNGAFSDYARQHCQQAGLSAKETEQWLSRARQLDQYLSQGDDQAILKALNEGLGNMRCFIKDELYDKANTTLRLIVSPPLDVKIIFGTVFKPIETELYSSTVAGKENPLFGHHFKHCTFDEVATILESIPLNDDQVFFETDYSAYESSQGVESLSLEYSIYATYYKRNTLPHKIVTAVAAANVQSKTKLTNRDFSVELPPMRWSGMPNTACGNLLMNFINLTTVCGLNPSNTFYCEGDDTIGVINRDWVDLLTNKSAYPVTIDTADRYSDLHFCGHHGERGAESPANEQMAFAKLLTYFAKTPLSLQKQYELLYLRSFSYQLLYPQWPGIKKVLGLAAAKFMGKVKPMVSQQTYRTWVKNNWWWLKSKFGSDVFNDSLLSYSRLPQPKGYLFPIFADAGLSPFDVLNNEPAAVEAEVIKKEAGIGQISFSSRLEACLSKAATTLNALGAPMAEVFGSLGLKKLAGVARTLGGALTATLNHAATSVGRANIRPFLTLNKEAGRSSKVGGDRKLQAEVPHQLAAEPAQMDNEFRPPDLPDPGLLELFDDHDEPGTGVNFHNIVQGVQELTEKGCQFGSSLSRSAYAKTKHVGKRVKLAAALGGAMLKSQATALRNIISRVTADGIEKAERGLGMGKEKFDTTTAEVLKALADGLDSLASLWNGLIYDLLSKIWGGQANILL